jgi:pimeloyl-ACP methyl ester carboxylesterase
MTILARFGRRAMIGIALTVTVFAAGCGGNGFDDQLNSLCDAADASAPAGDARPIVPPNVVIHMLRGLGDVYSTGLNILGDEMRALGLNANVHSDVGWQGLAAELAAEHQSQPNPPAIVLLGHSYGADDVIKIAARLKDQGIPVRLMILLDATNPSAIPSNVDRCVHFYIPWPAGNVAPGFLPGHPVSPEAGNEHTQIVNDSLGLEGKDRSSWCISHLGIDASKRVHSRILSEVFAL